MKGYSENQSPLIRSIQRGSKAELECFLKAGVDPNMRLDRDVNLLYAAVRYNQLELVDLLLTYKVNPNVIDDNGETSIHLATRQGNSWLCKLLLNYGASLDLRNARNQLPIDIALKAGFKDILMLYLNKSPALVYRKDALGKHLWEQTTNDDLKNTIVTYKSWKNILPLIYIKKNTTSFNKIPIGIFKLLIDYLK